MGLDARGDISVMELIVYIPLLFVSIFLVYRHGLQREGWIYLLLLSIIRILGAATHIASEQTKTPNITLHIIFGIMEASGISPLLLAALGFLGTVKQHGFEDERRLHLLYKIVNLAAQVALALTIAGGAISGSSKDTGKIETGIKLRHIGVIIFLIVFILVALMVVYLWMNKSRILKHRQTLLLAVTVSIPFLAIRVVYTVCSAYAPTGIPGVTSGNSSLATFNSASGSFAIYLVMSVIMEIAVVIIYVSVGLSTPLQKDYMSSASGWEINGHDDTKLNAPTSVYAIDGQSSSNVPRY